MSDITIESAHNPLFKALRKLVLGSRAAQKLGQAWLEGDHLCRAYLSHKLRPRQVVYTPEYARSLRTWFFDDDVEHICLSAKLMQSLSPLPSAAAVAFVIDLPQAPTEIRACDSIVLDCVQDAGNVGSILRSAAAFGFTQILALQGTAQLWSPKVLRSAMGAHFALELHPKADLASVQKLKDAGVALLSTDVHAGTLLHQMPAIKTPKAWVFGNEGQGVNPQLQTLAQHRIQIHQPGGEESLNVAAAAAICLHATAR